MSQADVENAIEAATPLVGAVATIGEARPDNTALIVTDVETRHCVPTGTRCRTP
ncbi:hypothetical protein ACW9HR_30410 [Nocardia gipuzkoensis]